MGDPVTIQANIKVVQGDRLDMDYAVYAVDEILRAYDFEQVTIVISGRERGYAAAKARRAEQRRAARRQRVIEAARRRGDAMARELNLTPETVRLAEGLGGPSSVLGPPTLTGMVGLPKVGFSSPGDLG